MPLSIYEIRGEKKSKLKPLTFSHQYSRNTEIKSYARAMGHKNFVNTDFIKLITSTNKSTKQAIFTTTNNISN